MEAGASQSTDPKEELEIAVAKAQILLSYASQQGQALDDALVKSLINARDDILNGKDVSSEAVFWASYAKLAKLLHPVTVASLQAVKETKYHHSFFNRLAERLMPQWRSKPTSMARKTVSIYRLNFTVTLVLMLAIQIYWGIGIDLKKNTEVILAKIDTVRDELDPLLDSLNQAGVADLTNNYQYKRLSEDLDRQVDQMLTQNILLYQWINIHRQPFSLFTAVHYKEPLDRQDNYAIYYEADRLKLQAEYVLSAISTYMLPLLYGLLGAFAFVMRRLSAEIKALQFTEGSKTNYRLRLSLGALSGLVIGWFLSPDSLSIEALSPLALAFLAGYSVELLFTIMDRLVVKDKSD